jgi:hypothetical protein
MRGKPHPPELRASAEALLLAGKTQSQVCEITHLEKTTVSRIAAALGPRLQQVATAKKEAYGELIMAYFSAALRAMISQAEVAGDPEYCRAHEPDKVAILHGVIGDKLAGIATTAQALGLIGTQAAEPALPAAAPDRT